MKSNIFFLSSLNICLSFCFFSCKETNENSRIQPVRNVILTEVYSQGDSLTRNFYGVVEEGKNVNAAFMTGGKLLILNKKEGDRVKKGELLASIDDTDYKIGVNQLKVQFQQMTEEKKRMDELFKRHNLAPNDYEKFEAGYEQLKLQLQMANNKLDYTKLYSPSDGFISYKYMQTGELVDAGTPIYKITDDSSLEVTIDLPLQVYLQKNDIKKAIGYTPGVTGQIPLNIESISLDADNNQLYHLKLSVPKSYSKDLTPGMNISVNLELLNSNSQSTLIPSRAIFDKDGQTFVWIFNDNDSTIHRLPVQVVGVPHNKKSMVNGLTGKEKIVTTGVKQLKDGEKVNVIPAPL